MRLPSTTHTSGPWRKPFRYLLVRPALMRRIERAWHADVPSATWAGAPA